MFSYQNYFRISSMRYNEYNLIQWQNNFQPFLMNGLIYDPHWQLREEKKSVWEYRNWSRKCVLSMKYNGMITEYINFDNFGYIAGHVY